MAYDKAASALGVETKGEEKRIRKVERPLVPWSACTKTVDVVTTETLLVETDEQTGRVLHVRNEPLFAAVVERGNQSEATGKVNMPTRHPSALVATVEQFFARVNGSPIPNDLRLQWVNFDRKQAVWEFGWTRYIKGYASEDEGMWASVDDVSGRIVSYHYNVTGATCEPVVRLSLSEASSKAKTHAERYVRKQAEEQAYEVVESAPATLQVVYPNYVRTEDVEKRAKENLRKAAKAPRLAYVFQYEFHRVSEGPSSTVPTYYTVVPRIVVWIDAATGDVLGGL